MADPSPSTVYARSARPRLGGTGAPARTGKPQTRPAPGYTSPDLPGCRPFIMTEAEATTYRGRFEAWDARTRIAWKVCDPVTIQHELPVGRMRAMAERIASVRGSPVGCFGAVGMVQHDPVNCLRWILQADETVYLHPRRVRPKGRVVNVDEDPLPDVVLEVDHTTDVRRWKLGMYMHWRCPEIWVLVPWPESVREPGLTIHLLGEEGYQESSQSRAFPGWRAWDIYCALTEEPITVTAWRALEEVGRRMGAREGTRPEDDPLTRSLSAAARAEGRMEGQAEGRTEGRMEGLTQGRAEGRAEAVLATLRARDIDPDADFAADLVPFTGLGLETLMAAALACTDEADFRRRLAGAHE